MNIVLKFAVAAAAVPISFSASVAPAAAQMAMPDGCKAEMHAAGDIKMPEMGQMADHQNAMMESMRKMHPAMMQGMMAKDPDVAFVCGMIGHHMGRSACQRSNSSMAMTSRPGPWPRTSSMPRRRKSKR